MGTMVARFDWASTPLGDASGWPSGLRMAVHLCLTTRFPMLVVWGDDLVKIYNDGYRALLGAKHPAALGAATRDVWPEIWDEIGPLFASVMETGMPTWSEHQRLDINRNGFLEECYFTWSYSPLVDEDGVICGVLDTVTETTLEVRQQRRLGALSDLATSLVEAATLEELCTRAAQALGRWPGDIPWAQVEFDVGEGVRLIATTGRVAREAGVEAPMEIPLGSEQQGVLRLEVNPRCPFDADYGAFVNLCATTIGAALDIAMEHSRAMGVLRQISDTLQSAMLTPAAEDPTVVVRYVPAAGHLSVGGDWYDVIELDGDREVLIVGDCVGHGLEAAGAMGQLRVAARAVALDGAGPAAVLDAMDRFAQSVDVMCTTMVCVEVNRRDGILRQSSAGHPPALVVNHDGARWIEGGRGAPLGIAIEPRSESTTTIEPGSRIVLYTDGLVERREEHIDVGLARLRATAQELEGRPIDEVADGLVSRLVSDVASDDVVVLVKEHEPTACADDRRPEDR
jgi:serine phosphatase RsbU (regulator of sigma subunit)